MERKDIDVKDTWDLTAFFKDQKAFEDELTKANQALEKLIAMKGHAYDTLSHFVETCELSEELNRRIENTYVYVAQSIDVEPNNMNMQQNMAMVSEVLQRAGTSTTFLKQEMKEQKDAIAEFIKDESAKDFAYPMQEFLRFLPHQLSDREETILAEVRELEENPSNVFSSIKLDFKGVNVDGKEEFLNGATYSTFLKNKDVNVRKEAFENYLGEYKKFANTYALTLLGNTKAQVFEAKMRNYNSALEASLFLDGVDKTLFDKVLYMANEKYHATLEEFFNMRKETLGLKEQHTYDIQVPLMQSVDKTYGFDEALDIIYEALAPLGETYVNDLKQAREQRWIDCYPHKDKRSGAYSYGSYDSYPYIMTNFIGTYDSMSTLAHELGHSMHSYYSRKNNRPSLASYKIFVAEVASTVNELLLAKHLLKTSDDKEFKQYIIANLLEQMVGTLYRQPMFAKFEQLIHENVENGVPQSAETLKNLYLQLNKDYYGDSVIVDDLQGYGCFYIPHFYYNFYVYKYTLGMSVALSFVNRIENGEVDSYLNFLTKGGSESPVDELTNAGVSPLSDQVYDEAFTSFKDFLQEFKELKK